ncbi:MAG: hypothetical protein CL395_01430 [Acidiferrobacteraceae bacterium]|jgi:hypothetical protein|nr:hypothetical protein [Acidiferrobacteraceae bacterium]MCP4829077.1 hypothetical protein [Pseudomonadota bacterium]
MEIQRELGVSHAVFFRSLAQLPAGWVHETRSDGATLRYAGGRVEISLGEECERRIALICIPYTPVMFRYYGLSEDERNRFQARFDLTFFRGGG